MDTGNEKNQQPLFENKIAFTRKVFDEFNATALNTRKLKTLFGILCIIIAGIGVLFSIMDLLTFGIILFFLSAFIFILIFLIIPKSISTSYQKNCELKGENWVTMLYFYNDYILGVDANSTAKYEYQKIGSVLESRNLCVLLLGDPKNKQKMGITVDKNGFGSGNYKSFKQFITDKCRATVKYIK